MMRNSESECFRQWNEKMIHESSKMIKLVLILLIGWTFITIGWIVHLILLESSRPPEAYLRFARGEVETEISSHDSFDQLEFYTIVNHEIETENDWKRIKMLIGGFHQLKEDSGKVPYLTIYAKNPLDNEKRTESLPWNNVEFKVISNSNSNAIIPSNDLSTNYNRRIWISSE